MPISLKMLPDLSITLKGINYNDLRDILTSASLQNYESYKEIYAKKPNPQNEIGLQQIELENIEAEKEWVDNQREIIDSMEKMILSEICRRNRIRPRHR
jgi:hypothetical protein